MFWADKLVENLNGRQVVNDSKTPSGKIHVGALRGPLVHDLAYRAALNKGLEAVYYFGSDDYDPLDSIPSYLDQEAYSKYLGCPLSNIPSPGDGKSSYADYYMGEFIQVCNEIGICPNVYRESEMYIQENWYDTIETILNNADTIRRIYYEVSGSVKSSNWYPFHVICENCGKIATTDVLSWDGKEVQYICNIHEVEYVVGCGSKGSVSPFNRMGKLPWKLSWCARWRYFGVTIEGAGKDHSVAGGSRDVSESVYRKVFGLEPPVNIPYEFLLVDSRKMSTSKGIGMSACEISDVIPPEILRFLLVKTQPSKAINFHIDGNSIPRLFDEYDKYREALLNPENLEKDEAFRMSTILKMSQIRGEEKIFDKYVPRFSYIATSIQITHIRLVDKISEEVGRLLTNEEIAQLERRAKYAKIWLKHFAPNSEIFQIKEQLPGDLPSFSTNELGFLFRMEKFITESDKLSAELIHSKIYELSSMEKLSPSEAFRLIYLCFLGKKSGPRAGQLISSLERRFAIERLQQAQFTAQIITLPYMIKESRQDLIYDNMFKISLQVINKFPELKIGLAVFKGIKPLERNHDLDVLLDDIGNKLNRQFSGINLGNLERIQNYRRIYRGFGVSPQSRMPSAEALLRRFVRGQGLPRINTVVDAYNMTSAELQIPMATYDLDKVSLPIELRFSEAMETFIPIGEEHPHNLEKGELIYADQSRILCRDFNYRDGEYTKTTKNTANAILFVDGAVSTSVDEINHAIDLTASRIIRFAGGKFVRKAILYKVE